MTREITNSFSMSSLHYYDRDFFVLKVACVLAQKQRSPTSNLDIFRIVCGSVAYLLSRRKRFRTCR